MSVAEFELQLGSFLITGAVAWVFAKVHWMILRNTESPSRKDLLYYAFTYFALLLPVRYWLVKNLA